MEKEKQILSALKTKSKHGSMWLWRQLKKRGHEVSYNTFYNHLNVAKGRTITDAHLNACISILKEEGLL